MKIRAYTTKESGKFQVILSIDPKDMQILEMKLTDLINERFDIPLSQEHLKELAREAVGEIVLEWDVPL